MKLQMKNETIFVYTFIALKEHLRTVWIKHLLAWIILESMKAVKYM